MNKPKVIKEVRIPNSNVFKVFYDTGGYGYRSIDPKTPGYQSIDSGTPYMNMNTEIDDQQRALPASGSGSAASPEEIEEMLRSMNRSYRPQDDDAIELIKKGK